MSKHTILGVYAYPSSPTVQRAIRSCAKAGMMIGAVEIRPDGTIKIVTQDNVATETAANDFDRFDQAGLL